MRTLWQCPDGAVAALVLAHGAGAGMEHRHMQALADAFGRRGIATLRFNFPYMDAGKSRTDPPAVAAAAIAEAAADARSRTKLPLWVGGHSFGGRMASHAVAEHGLEAAGMIFCSFPLHMPGKPDLKRAAHLGKVRVPMLFLSGTRDALAERALLTQVVSGLPRAEIHGLDTADHGFKILKRSRTSPEDVYDEAVRVARAFVDRV
ncbi:MAG TPA: alpha/beta fold hydrolase [Gammaproteobacteria bacterium]|nr:alpha/beta fold hydrolase [Gammaproteobacteria bacterium]